MNENILKDRGKRKSSDNSRIEDAPVQSTTSNDSLSFLDDMFLSSKPHKPKKLQKSTESSIKLTDIIGYVKEDTIDSNDHDL